MHGPPERYLAVHFSDWTQDLASRFLRRVLQRSGVASSAHGVWEWDVPVVVVGMARDATRSGAWQVVSCNEAAAMHGVRRGIGLMQAEAMCPAGSGRDRAMASCVRRQHSCMSESPAPGGRLVQSGDGVLAVALDPGWSRVTFDRVARALGRWIPSVAMEDGCDGVTPGRCASPDVRPGATPAVSFSAPFPTAFPSSPSANSFVATRAAFTAAYSTGPSFVASSTSPTRSAVSGVVGATAVEPGDPSGSCILLPSLAPAALVGELTGCGLLFRSLHGSEQRLMERIEANLRRRGFRTRLATASTVGVATAVARFRVRGTDGTRVRWSAVPAGREAEALDALPIESLRISNDHAESLRSVEVRTIGQLMRLRREGVASRFAGGLDSRDDRIAAGPFEGVKKRRGGGRDPSVVAAGHRGHDVQKRDMDVGAAAEPCGRRVAGSAAGRRDLQKGPPAAVLNRLDQALGVVPERLACRRVREPMIERRPFAGPVSRQEAILSTCACMIDAVMDRLKPWREGVRQLVWTFRHSRLPSDASTDAGAIPIMQVATIGEAATSRAIPAASAEERQVHDAGTDGESAASPQAAPVVPGMPWVPGALDTTIVQRLTSVVSSRRQLWDLLRPQLERIPLDHGIEEIACRVEQTARRRVLQGALSAAGSTLPPAALHERPPTDGAPDVARKRLPSSPTEVELLVATEGRSQSRFPIDAASRQGSAVLHSPRTTRQAMAAELPAGWIPATVGMPAPGSAARAWIDAVASRHGSSVIGWPRIPTTMQECVGDRPLSTSRWPSPSPSPSSFAASSAPSSTSTPASSSVGTPIESLTAIPPPHRGFDRPCRRGTEDAHAVVDEVSGSSGSARLARALVPTCQGQHPTVIFERAEDAVLRSVGEGCAAGIACPRMIAGSIACRTAWIDGLPDPACESCVGGRVEQAFLLWRRRSWRIRAIDGWTRIVPPWWVSTASARVGDLRNVAAATAKTDPAWTESSMMDSAWVEAGAGWIGPPRTDAWPSEAPRPAEHGQGAVSASGAGASAVHFGDAACVLSRLQTSDGLWILVCWPRSLGKRRSGSAVQGRAPPAIRRPAPHGAHGTATSVLGMRDDDPWIAGCVAALRAGVGLGVLGVWS